MKGNNIVQHITNYFIEQRILVGLSLVFLGLLVVPLWQGNSLDIYDVPGHVSLVWYIREYLWPAASGWNPFFLVGFPQGIFYPSLFHWLAAGISFGVGVDNAVKLIISGAILTLPFATFYAVKNTIGGSKYQLPATFLILLFLVVLPNFLGIGFRGVFQIGLVTNFVSTPLLLIFVGLLHANFRKGKILLLSLLLSALVLTHLVAAMVAALYFIIYSIFLLREGELNLKHASLVILITAFATAFYWVPFLLYFQYTSVSFHLASYFAPNLIVAALSLGLLFFNLKNKNIVGGALATLALILSLVSALDHYVIVNAEGSLLYNLIYPSHFYRFQPYAYLAFILSAASSLGYLTFTNKIKDLGYRAASLAIFIFLVGYILLRPPAISDSRAEITKNPALGGRFLESFSIQEVKWLPYTAQTKFLMQNPEVNHWAYGLFTDATPNGPYIGSLKRSLRPSIYPNGEEYALETKFIDQGNIQTALDIFGIRHLLNLGEAAQGEEIGIWNVGVEEKVYSVQEVGEGKLFEVMDLAPIPVSSNFDEKVRQWWLQKSEWSTLPFKIESEIELENIEFRTPDPQTKVEVIDHNKDWTKMTINIDSETPQPTLVKFSYFPWWSAHQDGSPREAGQEVQIYRAAPNQMLVFAKGEVDFEFKQPVWVKFLYLISAGTLLSVLYKLLRNNSG